MAKSRWEPGESGNPAGRAKGAKNKIRSTTKLWIKSLLENNRDQLEADFLKLDAKDRWIITERLLQYSVPKMQAVEAIVEIDQLTDEGIQRITTELLNSINDD